MQKLKLIIYKAFGFILVYSALFLALYGIGRYFHLFPPVKAIIQLVKIQSFENKSGENCLGYCLAMDKLADIYIENDYEKWGVQKREESLTCFVQCGLKNTIYHAQSLYKYSQELDAGNIKNHQKVVLDCLNCFLALYKNNQLNDSDKTSLNLTLLTASEFTIEPKEKVKLARLGLEVNKSIRNRTNEVIRQHITTTALLGFYETDIYTFWIEAQNHFENAVSQSIQVGLKGEELFSKMMYTRLLVRMQNFEYAKKIIDSCKNDIEEYPQYRLIYKKQLADVLNGLGKSSEAQALLTEIEILNYTNDFPIKYITLCNKARNEIMKGNNFRSYYYLRRLAWLIKKAETKTSQHLYGYYFLEMLYALRFNKDGADTWKSKIKALNISVRQNTIDVLMAEIEVDRLLNKSIGVEKCSDLFANLKDNIKEHFKYLTESQRLSYWSKFEAAIPILYETSNNSNASNCAACLCYDAALFSKGIILGSSIEFLKLISESKDSNLLLDYYHLLDIRQQLTEQALMPPKVDSLKILAERIERTLVQGIQELGDYTNQMDIDWQKLQSNMLATDVAIEFIDYPVGENTTCYSALILRKEWSAPKMIELFENKQLDSIFKNSLDRVYSTPLGIDACNLIWSKITPHLNSGDNIFFSPSNLLHKIAIENLPLNDSVRINEKFNLNRVSSTKQLCLQKKHESPKSAVLYGGLKYSGDNVQGHSERQKFLAHNDNVDSTDVLDGWQELPQTKTEVEQISEILNTHQISTILYTGLKGNEESFKALSGKKYDIIHLATHGFFYTSEQSKMKSTTKDGNIHGFNENPLLRSGLILADVNTKNKPSVIPSEIDNGILTAYEVALMNLRNTNLVVLSACKTGLGDLTNEGVIGLQRAFKNAGVQSIIVSLWNIPDKETSEFMQLFYKEWLLNGSNKRKALFLAQKSLRARYPSEPRKWAGLILID